MSGLPRPELPPGAHRELVDALHDLHRQAGWPSLRTLAKAAGCSHTTVSTAFSSPRLPAWGLLELLVESMHGDPDTFHRLWLEASAVANTPDPAPRIAGRRAELASVRRHLEAGTGLLLVTGEAGIGKTKLVMTARELTPASTFVALGSCLPLSTEVPLLPVVDLLRSVHDNDDGQWLREALADVPDFVGDTLAQLLPELGGKVATDAPADAWSLHQLHTTVARTTRALAVRRRLALVVEDLHWADSASLDLLEHLVSRGTPVPIVATFRTDDAAVPDATMQWIVRRRRSADTITIELGPLSRPETADQLALIAAQQPSGDWVDRIHGRSQGHPLFTEHLAVDASETNALPSLLTDLMDRSLEGISSDGTAVVRSLGVADRALSDTELMLVTGLDPDQLTMALRELRSRRLVSSPSAREVKLRHPLLAEAVRQRLVAGEATREHRRIATALAEAGDAEPAEVAAHWRGAGDEEQELVWRIRSARAANARMAVALAAEQWMRAVELFANRGSGEPEGMSQSDVYCNAIDALWVAGRSEAAQRLAQEAVAQLPDLEGRERADIYYRAGSMVALTGDASAGLQLLDEALDLYRQGPPNKGFIRALERRSGVLRHLERYDDATAAASEEVEMSSRLGDAVLHRRSLASLAWLELSRGDVASAFRRIRTATEMAIDQPDPLGTVWLSTVHSDMLLLTGATSGEITAAAQPGLDAAATWEINTFNSAALGSNLSVALVRAGLVADALALIRPLTEGAVVLDRWPLHLERGRLEMLRGDVGRAKVILDRVSQLPIPVTRFRLEIAEISAECDLWRGEPKAALGRLLVVLEEAVTSGAALLTSGVLSLAGRAAADTHARGSPSGPPDRLQELERRLRTIDATDRGWAAGLPADAAAHHLTWNSELSRFKETPSPELWLAAAAEWDRLARPHDAAYCRWRAAQVALANGQGTVAARLLKRAARDARQHVPLEAAIAATSRGGRRMQL